MRSALAAWPPGSPHARSIAPEPEGGSSRAHPHPCWSATGRRQQPPDQRLIFSTSHQRAVPFHPPKIQTVFNLT